MCIILYIELKERNILPVFIAERSNSLSSSPPLPFGILDMAHSCYATTHDGRHQSTLTPTILTVPSCYVSANCIECIDQLCVIFHWPADVSVAFSHFERIESLIVKSCQITGLWIKLYVFISFVHIDYISYWLQCRRRRWNAVRHFSFHSIDLIVMLQ